jgi:uncharacterized membrane protein YkoI
MRERINRKTVAIAAVIGALAVGGAGIAYAVGGDDDEQVTGPDADRAAAAAVDAVGGGTVTEVEHQDSDGAGVYEVEVQRPDGSQLEVHIGGDFQPLDTVADDDSGSGDDDAGEADD